MYEHKLYQGGDNMEEEEITLEKLKEMQEVDIQTVDPETLVDIQDVKIDTSLSKEERIRDFIRQIKNPYCYKCGKTIVKVSFADTDKTLEDRLQEYLSSL